MSNQNSRVALITGANKGIGFEIARQLGKAGCTVMLGARNPELGRKAAAELSEGQIDVRFVELGHHFRVCDHFFINDEIRLQCSDQMTTIMNRNCRCCSTLCPRVANSITSAFS